MLMRFPKEGNLIKLLLILSFLNLSCASRLHRFAKNKGENFNPEFRETHSKDELKGIVKGLLDENNPQYKRIRETINSKDMKDRLGISIPFLSLSPAEVIKENPILKTCHPVLQEIVTYIHNRLRVLVVTCHRTKEEQDKKVKQGRSWTRNSKHMRTPALAVDIVPISNRKIQWNDFDFLLTMNKLALDMFISKQKEGCYKGYRLRFGVFWTTLDSYHIELVKCGK